MDRHYQEQESKVLILILSLSLHTLALLLLCMYQYAPELLDSHDQKPLFHDVTTALSQSPTQGPQIIFQDEPEPQPGTPTRSEPASTTIAPPPSLMPAQEIPIAIPAPTQEEMPAPQDAVPYQQETPAPSLVTDEPATAYQVPVHETGLTESIPQRAAHYTELRKPTAKKQPRTYRPSQKAATALGSLTQGFIKSMQQERGNKPNPQEDMEQLSRSIYASKVLSAFRQSVNAMQKPTFMHKDFTTTAVITMTIDKSGKLIEFIFDHPNKTHDILKIESLLREGAQKAGLYPPIPTNFNSETFTKRLHVNIETKSGTQVFYITPMVPGGIR